MKKRISHLLVASAAMVGLVGKTHGAPASAAKPNFIIFIADDMNYHDLGAWGNHEVHTPNLDRLAWQGMKLTRMFSPAPICSPTRQALYTGLFPVRSGAYPNHAHVRDGVKSMVQYLKPLGYRVGLVGKTHFGPAASFPFEYPSLPAGETDETNAPAVRETPFDLNAASQFMNRDRSQPFCLVIASHEPHEPWTKGDPSAYQPETLSLPPYLVDTPLARRARTRYYAEITEMDRQVGEVMDSLDKIGLAEHTLFLWLSEQGSSMPHGKWTLYDVGIRAAAIARWPARIKRGSESDALMSYVDVLPTFIEAAGGTPDSDLDARSFLKVLTGEAKTFRDYVYAEQTSRGIYSGPEAYGIRCVRDSRYKYILNLNADSDFQNTEVHTRRFQSWQRKADAGDAFAREQVDRYIHRPAVELYDLQNDPWEMKNLADSPQVRETKNRLRAALDTWMKQQGDEGAKTEMEAKEHQAWPKRRQ